MESKVRKHCIFHSGSQRVKSFNEATVLSFYDVMGGCPQSLKILLVKPTSLVTLETAATPVSGHPRLYKAAFVSAIREHLPVSVTVSVTVSIVIPETRTKVNEINKQ